MLDPVAGDQTCTSTGTRATVVSFFFFFFLFFLFAFLELHLQHMEVLRLGVKWELYSCWPMPQLQQCQI